MKSNKVVDKANPYGFLYVDNNMESKKAEAILLKGGVRLWITKTVMDPQIGLPFIGPTFITREGTFRGLEAIKAYLGWFIYDPTSVYRKESKM